MRALKDIARDWQDGKQPLTFSPRDRSDVVDRQMPPAEDAIGAVERRLIARVEEWRRVGLGVCPVCRGMRWLRFDVSVDDKRFGRVRRCPCHAEYAVYGDKLM